MKQLNPKAVWLFFVQGLLGWIFLFVFLGLWIIPLILKTGFIKTIFSLMVFLFIILLIFSYIFARLTYHYYRYELTERGFRKESGIIWKRYVTIPYDRIQNVDINRGLIARLLGLSDLHIQTAGAGGVALGEGRLPGLSKDIAEQVRDEVLDRSRVSRGNQGL